MGMTSRDAFEITLRRLEETTAILQEERGRRDSFEDRFKLAKAQLAEQSHRVARLEEDNRALEQQRDAAVDERQKMIAAASRRETILARFYERAENARRWLDRYGTGSPAGSRVEAQSKAHDLAEAMKEAYEYCDQIPF